VSKRIYFAAVFLFSLQGQTLGRISFPTSGPPQAQQHFLRGVLLLHSFEYRQARKEFIAAQRLTPAFAMAYWGEAMTYNEPIWFAQDAAAARAALKRAESSAKIRTDREAAYLHAVGILFGSGRKEDRDFAYSSAMRRLHESHPNDDEAAVFYALSLLGTCHRGREFRTYMRAAAIVEDVLLGNPEHPGALHYAIHCYDDPVHAPLGLRAARMYAKVAPEAPHALHMPSHILVAMGMWPEAAQSNERAFAASRARQPMEAGGYHAMWLLEYAYLQQGRYAEARRVLERMESLASSPAPALVRFHLVQMRALYATEAGRPYTKTAITEDLDPPARAAGLFAAGVDALNHGNRGEADRSLASIRQLGAFSGGEAAHRDHIYPVDARVVSVMEKEMAALLSMADGMSKEALDLMKAAINIEDNTPFEFGPPSPPKPAHELFGEMFLSLGQPQLARVQFELALLRAPKRALSLLGLARAYVALGDKNAAKEAYEDLKKIWSGADPEIRKAVDDSLAKL
jgi:tetratricopeptide (TPR) repeat protein